MKRLSFLAFSLMLILGVNAQVFHDLSKFPLYGTSVQDATNHYSRFPDSLKSTIRKDLWDLGQNCAGISIRFATDSKTIQAKWTSLNSFGMNHMTPTGVRGLDLYMLMPDNTWAFVGSARPSAKNATTTSTIIKDMPKKMREYMLFLSLYDGITDLSIGTDKDAVFRSSTVNLPVRDKPIVMYGTSILQGGCASRPGMAHTNILQRWLNREVINLGFSGNAHLDKEIADLMAATDASVYVIDVLPNNSIKSLNEKLEPFYRALRAKRPDTPILFVENPMWPRTRIDSGNRKSVQGLNDVLHDFYTRMLNSGDKNLYYYDSTGILDEDFEGTVDGNHLTDYGFKIFSDGLRPVLEGIIKVGPK